MTSELRPAVEVWREAHETWDDTDQKWLSGEKIHMDDKAAAAIIEQDREAVRAEQAAELAKYKALAETLAFMLEAGTRFMPSSATVWHREAAKALRQYKEARDER